MELLKLEVECPRCGGETMGHVTCGECDGRGVVPTPQGEDILRFVMKYSFDVTGRIVPR